jgi:hypothetical protein
MNIKLRKAIHNYTSTFTIVPSKDKTSNLGEPLLELLIDGKHMIFCKTYSAACDHIQHIVNENEYCPETEELLKPIFFSNSIKQDIINNPLKEEPWTTIEIIDTVKGRLSIDISDLTEDTDVMNRLLAYFNQKVGFTLQYFESEDVEIVHNGYQPRTEFGLISDVIERFINSNLLEKYELVKVYCTENKKTFNVTKNSWASFLSQEF